ncbi:DUF2786 domain-containing protein [Sphingomonas canadensis]|uniref:DUF2786 domain-containing protein n=1 Tax=Sphingomonas canadensis TaxID=1219257 RepID=A0ABW3HA74_9SPHN|nr:DUF2786 domain-containing protein [Sphingomonas canadensis]MCW3837855.1 DUF2786 domain-containing protein [Sphingomonas canadensis]
MKSSPTDRARKCFAVAKSATIDGERAAALDRGMKILEKHGLDPDAFDIPGRERGGGQRAWREQSYSRDDF